MKRQGRYTQKRSPIFRSRHFLTRQWRAFKGFSRRKKIVIVATPIAAFLILTPIITYALLYRDISDPERLMNRNNTGVEIVDRHDQIIFSSARNTSLKRLQLSDISPLTQKALVSSEDKDFYKHDGFSLKAILGAVLNNAKGSSGGGSTLTQQLVKNTLLSSKHSFFRKYQELFMAVAVEQQYSKDEILDMYLNSVYFGEGSFGIDEAAHTYFNTDAKNLDLAQSAMLVGILPAPGVYSPINGDATKAKQRQAYVLKRMVEDGKITSAEKTSALSEVLAYAEVKPITYDHAPHFTEMVINQLYAKYGEENVKRSGYMVKTTLDLDWQKQAETIVANQTAINARYGGRNAALVAIDPKTGDVRALVGSANYDDPTFGKVNMATTARQPGSSFKPIYYTEAINEKKITAATVIQDVATDFNGYKPNNFDFKFRGNITVRNALSESLNIPAIKVMQKVGIDEAVKKAREMGITTIDSKNHYGLALALGAAEAKPLEMTNAYAAFANAGNQHPTRIIESIDNKYGETIFHPSTKTTRVQTSQASFIMSDILSDNNARASSFGSRLNIPGRKVAVKTGSTDDNRDAWTIGYTPSVAVGVWVGNNENEVMSSGGSALAGPIWTKSIQAFLGNSAPETFIQPSGVTKANACTVNGGTYQDYFINGTQPDNTCQSKKTDSNTAPVPTPQATPAPTEQPSTQPKDTDGDGVVDTIDQCPSTPTGVKVGSDGCPVAKPVDTDGDGVPDTTDVCPNTQAGATVGANGCSSSQTPPPTGLLLPSRRYS